MHFLLHAACSALDDHDHPLPISGHPPDLSCGPLLARTMNESGSWKPKQKNKDLRNAQTFEPKERGMGAAAAPSPPQTHGHAPHCLAQCVGHGVDGVVDFSDSTLSPATRVAPPLVVKFVNRARDVILLREAWYCRAPLFLGRVGHGGAATRIHVCAVVNRDGVSCRRQSMEDGGSE